MKVSTEETDIRKLQALCLRWNRAAASVGICGSEFVDEPERVFDAVRETHHTLMSHLVKAKKGTQ